MNHHVHTTYPYYRRVMKGFGFRKFALEEEFEFNGRLHIWRMRQKRRTIYQEMIVDWDWPVRARHSTGWKNGKRRRQWEHNAIEREKHERNRRRRADRAGAPLQ